MDPTIEKDKLKLEVVETELDFIDFMHSFPWYTRYFFYFLIIGIIPVFFITKYAVSTTFLTGFAIRQITAHEAIANAEPVQIIKAEILPLGRQNFSAYAQIKNPNPDLYSSDIQYTFHFKDASGSNISDYVEHTFLLGGEAKYIIVPNARLSATPASVTVDVTNTAWKRPINLPDAQVITGLPKWGDQQNPDGFSVTGTFKNLSVYKLHTVRISGIVFGKNGEIIAVSQTTANDLSSQEQRSYKLFWPFSLQTNTSNVKVYLETNILDINNLR